MSAICMWMLYVTRTQCARRGRTVVARRRERRLPWRRVAHGHVLTFPRRLSFAFVSVAQVGHGVADAVAPADLSDPRGGVGGVIGGQSVSQSASHPVGRGGCSGRAQAHEQHSQRPIPPSPVPPLCTRTRSLFFLKTLVHNSHSSWTESHKSISRSSANKTPSAPVGRCPPPRCPPPAALRARRGMGLQWG